MKTIVLSFALLVFATFSSHAQITNACDIISITTEFVSSGPSASVPGKCDVKVNISWEQVANNGNKFTFFHIWKSGSYQPYDYTNPSNPPQATDLVNTLGTIVVKDPSGNPSLYNAYTPDESYNRVLPRSGYTPLALRKNTSNGIDRFTVENVVLAGVDCEANGIYKFVADVWSSQQNQGQNVQCISQNNVFSINEIVDRSQVSCANGSLQLQLLSTDPSASGTVKVFADLSSFGKFDPAADVQITSKNFTTGTTKEVAGTWPYKYQSSIIIPTAYRLSNFWIQVIPNDGKATQVFLVSNTCTPLPENLSYFTATRVRSNVNLKWQTLNELNSKGFKVLRKTNGAWETIAFIPSNSGGASSAKVSYEFTDANNTFKGVSQYQVAEMTFDNKQKGSEIKAVKGENATTRITVFPNPSTDGRINLVFDNASTRDIVVNDMTGRVVKQYTGVTNSNIILENLQSGLYNVHITDRATNETFTEKMIVNKR